MYATDFVGIEGGVAGLGVSSLLGATHPAMSRFPAGRGYSADATSRSRCRIGINTVRIGELLDLYKPSAESMRCFLRRWISWVPDEGMNG